MSTRRFTIFAAGIILLIVSGSWLIGNAIPIKNAQTVQSADLNYISVYPDINRLNNPVLNVSWNITGYNWDRSNFPDCYLKIYGEMHSCPVNWPWPTCPLTFKIANPTGENRTNMGFRIQIPGNIPEGTYYLNLQCEILGGLNNETTLYESRSLDIIPIYFNSTQTEAARQAGMQIARDYFNCKNIVGNCLEWQQLATIGGRTFNETWGIPVQ